MSIIRQTIETGDTDDDTKWNDKITMDLFIQRESDVPTVTRFGLSKEQETRHGITMSDRAVTSVVGNRTAVALRIKPGEPLTLREPKS